MRLIGYGDSVRPGVYRRHSAFEKAVNFTDGERLVSLVAEDVGRGPINLVFKDFNATLCRGPLKVRRTSLSVGGRTFPFSSAERYASTLSLPRGGKDIFTRRLGPLARALATSAAPKSLAVLLDRKRGRQFTSGFDRVFLKRVRFGVALMSDGRFAAGARRLRGLGYGFTPSGDDFLAGFLVGLHVVEAFREKKLAKERTNVLRAALGQNPVSNAFLRCAHRGRLFGRFLDLLSALGDPRPDRWQPCLKRFLKMGATSAADTAAGFLFAMKTGGFSWSSKA